MLARSLYLAAVIVTAALPAEAAVDYSREAYWLRFHQPDETMTIERKLKVGNSITVHHSSFDEQEPGDLATELRFTLGAAAPVEFAFNNSVRGLKSPGLAFDLYRLDDVDDALVRTLLYSKLHENGSLMLPNWFIDLAADQQYAIAIRSEMNASQLNGAYSFGLAVTPVPAALPLIASDLGALGALAYGQKRRRQAAAQPVERLSASQA